MSQAINDLKLAQIKASLTGLTSEERQLLLAQVKNRMMQADTETALTMHAPHALTSAQSRLWVLEQFDCIDYLYHVPVLLALPSHIDLQRLEHSLKLILNRHTQLKSFFVNKNDHVNQHYQEHMQFHLQKIQLNHPLKTIVDIAHGEALSDFFLQPFDLECAPLFRVAFATHNQQNYLLFCFHHLIIDAWSVAILLDQLAEHYNIGTLNQAHTANLYREFQLHEAKQMQNPHYEKALLYWQKRLTESWHIDLPYDNQRPKHLSGKGQNLCQQVSGQSFNQLQHYAKHHQATINHVVLAAFQLLLARYSSQEHIYLGIPVAGRDNVKWHQAVGLFVNTCIHASKINTQQNFATHLATNKSNLLIDLENSIPFDYLLKSFYEQRLCAQGTSVNVLYNFIDASNVALQFDDQAAQTITTLLPVSKFDLSLHVVKTQTNIALIFEYSTDLFIRATMHQMMDDFSKLLDLLLVNDQLPINEVFWMLT